MVVPLLFMPMCVACFLRCRTHKTTDVMEKSDIEEKQLADHVGMCVSSFRLLADFSKRGEAVTRFEKTIGAFNKVHEHHGLLGHMGT